MKNGKNFLKKLRKGMTLLELVIAIALTSIIFAGAGTALFFVNRASKQETKNNATLLEAKNLYQVIDLLVKGKDRGEIIFPVEQKDNIGKENCDLLFTITDGITPVQYGFNKTVFGVIQDNKIEGENVKYTSDYNMYLSYKKYISNKFTEFVIHYGDNYASSLSLVERI